MDPFIDTELDEHGVKPPQPGFFNSRHFPFVQNNLGNIFADQGGAGGCFFLIRTQDQAGAVDNLPVNGRQLFMCVALNNGSAVV